MSRRFTVGVVALATAATLAALPRAEAAGRSAPPVVEAGRTVVVSGSVPGPARRTVILQRRAGSTWKVVARSRTATDHSFTLRAKLSGRSMKVRVSAPRTRGSSGVARAWRGPARTIRASRTRVSFTSSVASKVWTARARVVRPCRSQTVALQSWTKGSWRSVRATRVQRGRASLTVTRPGTRTPYRLWARGCGGASPSVSPVLSIPGRIVDPPPVDGPLAYRVLSVTSTVRETGVRSVSWCPSGVLGDELVTEQAQDIPETGGPRWIEGPDPMGRKGAFVFVSPQVLTTYTHHLRGCRMGPPAQSCTATIHDAPSDRVAPVSVGIFLAPGASQGTAMFYPGAPLVGFPFAGDAQCNVAMMDAPGSQPDDWRRTINVPASTLRGYKPFTVAMENTQSWTHDAGGRPTDLAVHWKVNFVLQRVR